MTYSILISSKHLQSALEVLAALALLLAVCFPRMWSVSYARLEGKLSLVAKTRWRAIALAAAAPMAVRVILLPWFPVPIPHVHDEFSYLLLGDTFAHGRLTNPTPPEWKHFETEYVLLKPTYASQYQPAQGVVLAAGQAISGNPWWGVWASVGLMCGALCWALSFFFPLAWALFGSLAAALQFGIFGFWMNSYFGGAVAATGGALVAGSLMRIRRKPASSSAMGALGLVILFASRPLEGALWGGVAALRVILLHRDALAKIIPAAACVLAVGAAALTYYNAQVTGDPLDPPYAQARRTYGTPQSFWIQPAVTVARFDNPQLRDNYLNQLAYWNRRYSAAALWDASWRRLRDFWRFFIGPFFTPALCFLGFLWRDKRVRPWLLISAPFIAEHATYHAWYPQQSASETVLILVLLVQCWRHLRVWQRRRGWGLAMSRTLVTAFVAAIVLLTLGRATESRQPSRVRDIWASLVPPGGLRNAVAERLQHLSGKHLVFVHYSPTHPYIDEWVSNGADIQSQKVVFSRLLDPASDRALETKLGDREVWIADPDAGTLTRVRRDSPDMSGEEITTARRLP